MKKISLIVGTLLSVRALAQTAPAQPHAPASDALPTGGRVVAGDADIAQDDAAMTITQSSERAALDWDSFDVGSEARVDFLQPSANAVVLNRVTGSNPSRIFGRITSNGQVFLSNPDGVYFAPSASVDVGSLVATTHAITLDDFVAGRARFERDGAAGSVINAGELRAAVGGYIALLAPEVRNQGVILANLGTVALAAGEAFELQFGSNNTLANLRVEPGTLRALIDNASAVLAPGGLILLSAQAVDQVQGGVIRNSGTIEATGLVQRGGRILLEARQVVQSAGALLDASGASQGGDITVLGNEISLQSGSALRATGATGGGTVLVGGAWQGGDGLPQAERVSFEAGASIDVSATARGDGGTAVLWSDVHDAASSTTARGQILARGGAAGGNGGRIETSGHAVDVSGLRADAAAPAGKGGQWLIDPYDYTIDAVAATAIGGALSTGTSVLVTTTAQNTGFGSSSNSADAGDIAVNSAITKNGGGDATLTLQAHRRISVDAPITSAAGRLNLVLWSDYGNTDAAGVGIGTSGTLATNGGHVWIGGSNTAGGSLTWNGLTVGDGPSVGAAGANLNGMNLGANITTAGGDVLIWAGAGVGGAGTGPGIGLDGARSISTGSGSVTLLADHVFNWQNSGTLALSSTGTLSLAPVDGSYDATFNWGGTGTTNFLLNNTLSSNVLTINAVASLGGLSVGRYAGMVSGVTPVVIGNSSNVSVGNAISIAGPVSLYGDNVSTSALVSSTLANAGVLLKALHKVTVGGGISTIGGDITLWANAEGASGGGIEVRNGQTLSSSGGWITLGGSADGQVIAGLPTLSTLGTALPTGYARDGTVAGVSLGNAPTGNFVGQNAGITLNSAGGRVGFAGRSTVYGTNGGNTYSFGFLAHNGVAVNAGGGDIVVEGLANGGSGSPTAYNVGASWSPFNTNGNPSTWTTQGGNIRLNGTAAGNVQLNTGVAIDPGIIGAVTFRNTGTNGGSVSLTGSASGGTLEAEGLRLSYANLLGASGTIDLVAGAGSLYRQSANKLNMGSLVGSGINTSTATITLSADKWDIGSINSTGIATSGLFRFQPTSASFSNATVTWPVVQAAFTVGALTIGKPGNTSGISIPNALTLPGNISVYGGSVTNNGTLISNNGNVMLSGTTVQTQGALQASNGTVQLLGGNVISNGGITAANVEMSGHDIAIAGAVAATNTLTLQSTGTVSQSLTTSINASSLRLLGGNINLSGNSNQVGTLAAAGVGTLNYVDSDDVTVDTVGGTSGVSASGAVSIATATGDLTVAAGIATTDTTATALTLTAGRNKSVGNANEGNILMSGTPAVTVGAGGTARLFSGSVANSTGLAALVGSGSGRFRYNSNEGTQNYSLALSPGLNVIYRERPVITRAIDPKSMTYGDSLPALTLTATGMVNGDSLAQAFSSAPTLSVAGPYSTSGNVTAGSHAITATGGATLSQLGYGVAASISDGTLTVAQRSLLPTFTGVNRVYDGTTTAGVTSTDNRLAGDVLAVAWTSATFGDANVGAGKAVGITGINLTGADAANYTPASTTGSTAASITPRTLSLSATRAYDGTTALGSVTFGNLVGSEMLGFSGATANDAHVATAGKFINAITLANGSNGGLASNYQLPTLNAATAPVTIAPRALTATAAIGGVLVKQYDGNTTAPGATVSGTINGAVPGDSIAFNATGLTAAFNSPNVATASNVSASGSAGFTVLSSTHGSVATDYAFTVPVIAPATASITPKAVTITGVTAASRSYDGTAVAQLSSGGSVSTGIGSETLTLSAGSASFNNANAGNGKVVTATGFTLGNGSNGGLASNYQLTSNTVTTTANITPAILTVTANDSGKYVTVADDPAYNGVRYSGFVNGETAAVLSGAAVVTRNNPSVQRVGRYGGVLVVNVSGLSAGNYSFVTQPGTFTISPSQLLPTVPTPWTHAMRLPASETAPNLIDAVGMTGITIVTVAEPGAQQAGVYAVRVPENFAVTGFAIDLPASFKAGVPAGARVTVRASGSRRLPDWLRYDARRQQFVAAPTTAGAKSARIEVRAGGRTASVLIDVEGPPTTR